MNDIIIIFFVIILIIISNINNNNNELFGNIYVQPSQQQVFVPIYSPYRMYYPLDYIYPSMFAPFYSQYDIFGTTGARNFYYY
jgi:hypothetical protein